MRYSDYCTSAVGGGDENCTTNIVSTNVFSWVKYDTVNPGSFTLADSVSSSQPQFLLQRQGSLVLLLSASSIAIVLGLLGLLLRKRIFKLHCSQPYSKHLFPISTNLPPCQIQPPHTLFGHMSNVCAPPDSPKYASLFVNQSNSSGISTFWFLSTPCVSVLKAEHARYVFRNSVERSGAKIIARHIKRALGQESLVMMNAAEHDIDMWRQHRNLVKVAFTTHAVRNMANMVWQVANGLSKSILQECTKNKTSQEQEQEHEGSYCQEASDLFRWATIDIFGKVALDYPFQCTETLSTTPLAQSLDHTIEGCSERCKAGSLLNPALQLYWIPTKKNKEYQKHSDHVHDTLSDICRRRMKHIEVEKEKTGASSYVHCKDDDLLTSLLKSKAAARDIKPNDSHEDSVKMLLTLVFAGYDTSSVLLSMAMWLVARNPKIQEECANESRSASTSNGEEECSLHEDPTQWESRLAYCRAVIMEVIRLHPPVYTNSRNLSKDIELDGCIIPKGTRVYLPILQIHTDERNFASPTEFLPERWVRRDANTGRWVARDYNIEPKSVENDPTFIPPANPHYIFTFSDGARNCVGHRLALQESTIIFACLLRDLAVNLPEGFVMQKRRKLTLAVPDTMPLTFRKRHW